MPEKAGSYAAIVMTVPTIMAATIKSPMMWTGSLGLIPPADLNWCPHFGQAAASVETALLQLGHLLRDMGTF
jgi:hypothetical protein